jgi:prepilin signal peptidase PulO-like enzyme (type II secretory pathway)
LRCGIIMLMIIFGLFILGLAFGSFINALVWRLHEQENTKSKKRKERLSITKSRSMCPDCEHDLAPRDLLPVVSWVTLKGKCRYCHKPISWQYPFVELLTAVLFVLSYALWPYGWDVSGIYMFFAWLSALVGLIALAVYDIKWMLLPNRIVYPLIAFWSVVTITSAFILLDYQVLLSAILGLIFCGGLFWVLFQVSNGRWIGGGDVKLGFLLGLIVGGPLPALGVVFLSSLFGTVFALPLLAKGSVTATSKMPYGPFLIAAAISVFLVGPGFSDLIQNFLLFT